MEESQTRDSPPQDAIEPAGEPEPYVGAPPPPVPFDPGFSRFISVACAVVLIGAVGFVLWLSVAVPKLERVLAPERALQLTVGRTLEVEEALKSVPSWERGFYGLVMGDEVQEQGRTIEWYEELAAFSDDPLVDLNLAILEAELGRLPRVITKIAEWKTQGEPYALFADALQAAYVVPSLAPEVEQDLQSHLAELLPAGWFYDRLALRLATKSGDESLQAGIETLVQARAKALLWRSRLLIVAEVSLLIVGAAVLVWMWRHRSDAVRFRVGAAHLPPLWPGAVGAGVLLRGGALGAGLVMPLVLLQGMAGEENLLIRLSTIPLSNLPLLLLAYFYLLKPQGIRFAEGFGLHLPAGSGARLGMAVAGAAALGLAGEWVMGKVAEPLNLTSHWTEWFDADLVWSSNLVMVAGLVEYVVFAPAFEELAFRGVLFGVLRRRYSLPVAAVFSSLIFATAHGYGLVGFVSVFWSGLIWAWTYEKTGSLLPGMIAHGLNNLLVCLSVIALLRY
jgi:membrane protease YdiL (CAAX protease family)